MGQADKDIAELVRRLDLSAFAGKTVLVTGATGLIGSTIVKTLLAYDACKLGTPIRVVAVARNLLKAQAMFSSYATASLVFAIGDIKDAVPYQGSVDYVVHCASTTASKAFVSQPVETIVTAIEGTRQILEFCRQKHVAKCVYLSSLEVYGVPQKEWVDETTLSGFLDWTQIRSSYSEGKRMCECLCMSYASEYQVPVVVARLAQTFGAGFAPTDNRVFAQFIRAGKQGLPIVLRTKGQTVRDYCYVTDAVAGILVLLQKGMPGESYNIANEATTCSIREMADLVVALTQNGSYVKIDESVSAAKLGYNPIMKIQLVSDKLRAMGWKPDIGLREAFIRMLQE